jgi:hypothetical protein
MVLAGAFSDNVTKTFTLDCVYNSISVANGGDNDVTLEIAGILVVIFPGFSVTFQSSFSQFTIYATDKYSVIYGNS